MRVQATISSMWLLATPGLAASGLENELAKRTESINVEADYSVPVIKSDTVGGTDFGHSYRAAVSAYAGATKALGIAVRYEKSAADFSQVDATTEAEWIDFRLTHRFWVLYPTLVAGSVAIKTTEDGLGLVDAVGLTRGGGLLVKVPVGADALIHFETIYSAVVRTVDVEGRDVGVGARLDVDLGASAPVLLDQLRATAGYRYRSYAVSIDDSSEREFGSGPYLGFSLGFSP